MTVNITLPPTECDCNGLASRCVFDQEVFDASGSVSGGVCVGCRSNTAGMNLYTYVLFLFSSLFVIDT